MGLPHQNTQGRENGRGNRFGDEYSASIRARGRLSTRNTDRCEKFILRKNARQRAKHYVATEEHHEKINAFLMTSGSQTAAWEPPFAGNAFESSFSDVSADFVRDQIHPTYIFEQLAERSIVLILCCPCFSRDATLMDARRRQSFTSSASFFSTS